MSDLWYYKNKEKPESTLAFIKKTTFGIAVRLFLLKYFLLIQIHGQMREHEGCKGMWRIKVLVPWSSYTNKIPTGPYEMDEG